MKRTIATLTICVAVLAPSAYGTLKAGTPTFDTDTAKVCFPAEAWNANTSKRPCVDIQIYEDGTYKARTICAGHHPARDCQYYR